MLNKGGLYILNESLINNDLSISQLYFSLIIPYLIQFSYYSYLLEGELFS